MRQKKTSTDGKRWALFQRFDIHDPITGKLYLKRYRIVETPFFGFYIHFIYGPDPQGAVHNHPYNFIAFAIKGSYVEKFVDSEDGSVLFPAIRTVWFTNIKYRKDFHRITSTSKPPVITILFRGIRRDDWGFLTPNGFVPHKPYLEELKKSA